MNELLAREVRQVGGARVLPDPEALFVETSGLIEISKMHDYLHLTGTGYRLLQNLLIPVLDELFK